MFIYISKGLPDASQHVRLDFVALSHGEAACQRLTQLRGDCGKLNPLQPSGFGCHRGRDASDDSTCDSADYTANRAARQ